MVSHGTFPITRHGIPRSLEPFLQEYDIGRMKLDALISRGSRKDFYDLYFIAQQISVPDLLALGPTKYPYARDFQLMAIEGMIQFDNAEHDVSPEMLLDVSWDEVKSFFVAQARALGDRWFGEQGSDP